ncbi:MAG: hypothetical protein ABSB78_05595 [Bacteroidota bacterium]
MNKVSTKSIKWELDRIIRSADGIYIAMLPYVDLSYKGIHENPLHPLQATKIVELSFMNIVSAWEEFVQEVFVRYMLGGISESGYSPTLRMGKCQNLNHALELLSGKAGFDPAIDYLDWSNWSNVINKAKIYFKKAEPFSLLLENQKQLIKESAILRNRVAHSSKKCKQAFTNLAKKHLNLRENESLPRGFSVGRLLISDKVRGFGEDYKSDNYYQSFSVMFRKMSNIIAP